jgi:hypothetical protein
VGAGLLGLFLIGLGIGHLIGAGGGSGSPSAAAPQQSTQPSTAPTTQPTATPAQNATPAAGTGNARFQRTTASIPSKCTTSQGCPVQITLKNSGERGSGTVTLTLTDGTNAIATFNGPIPTTDAGQTVTVTGYANGDGLPAYLRSGGTVYVSTIDIKNG